jgi:carnitine O-acetyltransferase
VDGLVPATVGEYSVIEGICESAFDDVPENVVQHVMANDQEGWERLEWVTDNAIRTETFAAEERAVAIISDSDLIVFWFNDYGADWIKDTGWC